MAARSLSLLVASVACMQAAPTSPVVQTQDGSVQGFMNAEGGGQFLGIPFAAPPLGNLRWVVPQPVTPWAGVRSAVTYPPDCIQFYLGSSRPQSENCLYLNVFVPPGVSSAHLAPVLVFIPSGVGFYGGGTGDWDASVYAANIGAVVVTLNHRVGLLGFMTVDAASASAPDAGNFSANVGLLDQRAALVWVQGNIRGFGGDPGRVTLSGQSAGGASVLYHLTMPQSFPLFDQVLAQSPGAPTLSRTTAQGVALSVANESQVNCVSPSNASLVDVECMRAVPTQALVAAAALVQASLGMYALGPSIDGEVVPGDYIALLLAGQFKVGTPLLVGNVMFEGDIFATSMAGSVFGYPATALNMSQYDVLVPDILHPMYVTAAADVAAVESDYAYCTQSIGIYNTSAAIAGDSYVNCNAHWAAHSAVNASISSTPVFRYWWNVSVPQVMRLHIQPLDRVTHMGDIFLLFNGRVEPPFNFTLTADQVASVGIAYGYIANFLATGNPNTGTFAAPIAWPTFSAVAGSNSTLVLQGGGANPTFLSSDYENDSCDRTWQRMLVK